MYRAECPYCEWTIGADSKQTVQHERFEHIWTDHEDEKKIPWNKDLDPVIEVDTDE